VRSWKPPANNSWNCWHWINFRAGPEKRRGGAVFFCLFARAHGRCWPLGGLAGLVSAYFSGRLGAPINTRFYLPASQPQRLAALVVVALLLMWTDSRYDWAQPLRYGVGYVLAPAQQTALVPQLIGRWFGESATSRQQLQMENQQLQARNLV